MFCNHLCVDALCKTEKTLVLIVLVTTSFQAYSQIRFEEVTRQAGPFHTGESWGASWGHMNNDLYPDLFVSNHGMRTSLHRNNGDGTFTDVVTQVDIDQKLVDPGNDDTTFADIHGGVWADFDNDGDQDLFVARSSKDSRMYLFENDGNGNFVETHQNYNIPSRALTSGRMPIFFDYNADGLLDFAYAKNGSALELFKRKGNDFVYAKNQTGVAGQCTRNNYGFTSRLFDSGNLIYMCMEASGIAQRAFDTSTLPFTDVTSSIDHVGTWSDAVLADVNNDARLDMVITTGKSRPNAVKKISDERIEAWLTVTGSEEKSFRFKAAGEISVNLYARKVASKNKFNGDQYDKIFLGSNGGYPATLPVNLDPLDTVYHGVIEQRIQLGSYIGYDQVAGEWVVHLTGGGDSDLVYFTVSGVDLSDPEFTGMTTVDGPRTPEVLINNGTRLEDIPGAKGLQSELCGAVVAEDFDNDMDVDLYLVCRTSLENLENRFYWNNGDGTFTAGVDHGAEGIVGLGIDSGAGTGEMAVTADYDIDGFMDIFVTNGNRLFPHYIKDGFTAGGPDQLFHNTAANANRWLAVDLQGVNSNRDGLGTKVTVTAGGVTQLREQNGKYHRWSQDHRRLHFGLGRNTSATVTVHWPDGSIDVHENVVADKLYLAKQDGSLDELYTPQPRIFVYINDLTVNESGDAELTVSLSRPSTVNVVVDYITSEGSAKPVDDYQSKSGTIVFTPGQTEKTRTVALINDELIEGEEQFTMLLSNPKNAVIDQSQATITIEDDDFNPVVSMSTNTPAIKEGGIANFTFRLSHPTYRNVVIDYATVNASAIAPDDFTPKSGRVVFEPGETIKTRNVTVVDDELIEPEEAFDLVISNPVNSVINQPKQTITILDNDLYPRLTISSASFSVDEGSVAELIFSLSKPATKNVVFNYTTVDGTAKGTDYSAKSGVIVFAPGETIKSRMFATLKDNISDPDEQFSVVLSNPVNTILDQTTAIITIVDNISVYIDIADVSVSEGQQAAITVTLSQALDRNVVIDYETSDGTAVAGADYISRAGKLVFAPGETVKTRSVNTVLDNVAEPAEQFEMKLTNAVNVSLVNSSAVITITD